MSKGGGKPTTTTQEMRLPEWANQGGEETWNRALAVADRPYDAYGGDTVAGLTADQTGAADRIRGVQGQADSAFASSGALASGLAGGARLTTPDELNAMTAQFMNPYTNEVINRATADIDRQGQIQDQRLRAGAAQAGAFGGDRHGVAEGVAAGETSRAVGDISAQLRAQGYSAAQAMAMATEQANQGRAMQGLQLAPQIAAGRTGQALTEANAMSATGLQQQQQEQTELTDQYRRWLEERNYPTEMVGLLTGTLAGLPMGYTQTGTTPNNRNAAAGAAGGALQGAAIGSAFGPWGAAAGAVGGGILGGMG